MKLTRHFGIFLTAALLATPAFGQHMNEKTRRAPNVIVTAHDFQFRVLIVHRGLYVAVPHRSHYGSKVAGSHQNSRTVVMSRTVKDQLFWKARFVARFSEEIAN
jgi:hypothetical protein